MTMNRKQFLEVGVGMLGAAVGAALTGCGSDSGDGDGAGGGGGGCSAQIVGNHGHSLVVSRADVDAGVAKTYSIKGSSPHTHEVTLTAAHFEQLKAGQSVSVTSSSGAAHTHSITVRC